MAIADRFNADALNREWDAYVRSVGTPSGGVTGGDAGVRALHRLDDAPAPDPVFLARTWQRLHSDAVVPKVGTFGVRIAASWLPLTSASGHQRPISVRFAAALLGVVVIALGLASERLLPAHGDAPLVASALASVHSAGEAPVRLIATNQANAGTPTRAALATEGTRSTPTFGARVPTATPAR